MADYVAGAGARGRGERRRRVLVLPTLLLDYRAGYTGPSTSSSASAVMVAVGKLQRGEMYARVR
jgi:hypothetical protein